MLRAAFFFAIERLIMIMYVHVESQVSKKAENFSLCDSISEKKEH